MENWKDSKNSSEPANVTAQNVVSCIQKPSTSYSLPSDNFAIVKEVEVESSQEPNSSQKTIKPHNKVRKFFTMFVEACLTDTDHRTETIENHAKTFFPDGFAKLSENKLNGCFNFSIKSLYKNFDKLSMHRDVFSIIYEDTRQSNESVRNYSAAFERLCEQEKKKITNNEKWDEIVMFGAVLCELSLIHHENLSLITKKLNLWINEIIKSALGGNEKGLIAFMLILNRLIKNGEVFDQINRGYFKILKSLLGDGNYESKLKIIDSCLNIEQQIINNDDSSINMDKIEQLENGSPKIQNLIQPDDSEYLEEVAKSEKCKDFDEYLKSTSNGDNDCCDFFSDATSNELEYFARKFIDFGLENPKEIKILGSIASKYQTSLIRSRKFIKDLVKSLETEFESLNQEQTTNSLKIKEVSNIIEFEVMKQEETANSLKIENFAKFLGELYVSDQQVISPAFMTQCLIFLMNNREFETLTTTLNICGYLHGNRKQKDLKTLMKSSDHKQVEDEIAKISERFKQIHKSRLFKPAESSRKIGNLELILSSIAENRSVKYDYELLEMMYINTRDLITLVIKILKKPNANVIEVAKFLKSFHDFTYKVGSFLQKLKKNLEMKVLDMSVDNLQEMRIIGKFIAELKNLGVTNNESQKLWLKKVKSFNNFEVMEVYIDVLKPMLVNIQVYEYENLLEIHEYIQDINKSLKSRNTEITTRIKSKIAQILQNIVTKKIDSATSELLFKIRLGHKIDGFPRNMPEYNPNVFDVQDFAKIFYINAISNHHFTQNYANAIIVLKFEPQGAIFIQTLKDTLTSNLYPNISSSEFWESDEAPEIFEFILHLFYEEILSESEIISLLQTILDLENLENHKNFLIGFADDLQLVVARGTRTNDRKFSQNLKNYIAKVQNKPIEVDVESVKVKNVEIKRNQNKKTEVKQVQSYKMRLNLNFPIKTGLSAQRATQCSSADTKITSNINKIEQETKINSQKLIDPQSRKSDIVNNKTSIDKKHPTETEQIKEISDSSVQNDRAAKCSWQQKYEHKGLAESYNEILPKITSNVWQLKKCAFELYSCGIDDPDPDPKLVKLVDLLSLELRNHHKDLLTDMCKELRLECDILHSVKEAKQLKGKAFSQQRNSFISTFRAVIPFLEKRQIYDILHFMLIYIRDGNRIALELFLDVTEGMEDVFKVDSNARNNFVTFCVKILDQAANFKNLDEGTVQRTLKMLEFFKNLKITSENSQNSETSSIQGSCASQVATKSEDLSQSVLKSGMPGVSSKSTGKSSQNVQLSGKSSQITKNASSSHSNDIVDPPENFTTDGKVTFYISQLQPSNIQRVGSKISSFLANSFSEQRLLHILFQKGISDQKYINSVIDLFKFLFKKNNFNKSKECISKNIENEFIKLCKNGGKLEEKMMNLVKFTIAFDSYLQSSFLYQLWSKLLDYVEQDCPNSLSAFVLLISDKVNILFETKDRRKFMAQVLRIFRKKLDGQNDKSLKDKMTNIIKTLEQGIVTTNISKNNSQAKLMQGLTRGINLLNISKESPESEQDGTSKNYQSTEQLKSSENPAQKAQTTTQQFQSPNNQDFIQVHPDDKARSLNFTPDYFLFDNLVTNSQKFERILKSLCENCDGLENNEENSIKIKEFIAVAIIKVNFLKIQAKTDEIMKFSEIFFELYTSKNQTKFMQWVLMKFLKAWKLYDRNHHYVSPANRTKIYDRYSKSVLRVKKSFQISNTTLLKNDSKVKSDDITSKLDVITSKSENSHKPEDIASTSDVKVTKAKSMTSKSRTITLRFDDLVPRSEKTVNFVATPKFDDVSLKSENITSKSEITSNIGDMNSKSGELTSKSSDITSKPGDLTSKSSDITSKPGDLTSNIGDVALNSSDKTSKSYITSKSISNDLFISFMASLQILILNHLTDTTVDVDRDPFYDYFSLEKKRAYEIVCDLYFQDIISTNFVTNSIIKMFEYPLIIDKNIDVVVRLMKLVDKMTRIRNKDKNFLEVLQTLWLRLPFGVELMFPVSVDKWTKLKNFIDKSLLYVLNTKEFRPLIESFWSELMENPEKFSDIVEIFEDFLEVFGDCFACLIMDFMEYRRISLEKFPAKNITKAISLKYKTSILFAFELFEMGMLNCESFSKWINDDVCLKLVQEHNYEILMKFGQKGLKIDENLDDKLKIYYKKLNIIG